MSERISVEQYLENKELLQVKDYIPHAKKVLIIDSIMKQVCIVVNGTYNLDSVLLNRVKMQIFIEQCTNLDLSVMSDIYDGYDLLKKEHCFKEIVSLIANELEEFEYILQLRIDDFVRDKASVKGILNYKIEAVRDYVNTTLPEVLDRIEKIDIQSITQNFSTILDNIIDMFQE